MEDAITLAGGSCGDVSRPQHGGSHRAARGPDRVAPSTWRGVRGPGGGPAEFGVCVVVTQSGRRAWALAEGGLGGPGQAPASSGCPSGGRAHLAKIRGAVRVRGDPFSVYVMLHLKVLVT